MSAHAVFAPSSAKRWMTCPASIPLTKKMHATSSMHTIFTASGTVIHAIAEQVLRAVFLDDTDYRPILDHAVKGTWGDYAEMPPEFARETVDNDMIDQVLTYLFEVRDLIDDGDVVHIEKRTKYNDNLFGTVDLVVEKPHHLVICDLKTGSGNLVSSWHNEQLLTYAGIYMSESNKEFPTVELVIVQPPAERPRNSYLTTSSVIFDHMIDVEQAMLKGEEYDPEHLRAGKECKWCPCRAACPELDRQARLAMNTNLDGLTPERWNEVLDMATILKPWCESVFQRANQLATEENLHVPGWKMVNKMGRKTWKSSKEAEFAITEMLDQSDVDLLDTPNIWNPATLRTPTQVAKVLKDIIDPAEIEELTVVPHRGTILVPESDKREPVETGENLLKAADQLALFS